MYMVSWSWDVNQCKNIQHRQQHMANTHTGHTLYHLHITWLYKTPKLDWNKSEILWTWISKEVSKTVVCTRLMEGSRSWLTVLLTSHSDDTRAASHTVKLWTEALHCAHHPPLYSGLVLRQLFVHASQTSVVNSLIFISMIIYGVHATLKIKDHFREHMRRTLVMSIVCSWQINLG